MGSEGLWLEGRVLQLPWGVLSKRVFGPDPHLGALEKTPFLVNHGFARVTPAIFVIFGFLRTKTLFFMCVECKLVIFAVFRQNPLFSAGGKTTVSQNHPLNNPDVYRRTPRGSCNRTRLLEGFLEGSLKGSAS